MDDWTDDEWYYEYGEPPKNFAEVYPDFDTGECNPGIVYPISHGADCKGHPDYRYSDYKWAFVRVPPVPFQGDTNVVRPKEEYL